MWEDYHKTETKINQCFEEIDTICKGLKKSLLNDLKRKKTQREDILNDWKQFQNELPVKLFFFMCVCWIVCLNFFLV